MKIKELRKNMGLTQNKVASALNVSQTTFCDYENGVSNPDVKTLIKLADFFNVSIDELVGRESDLINLKYLNETENYLIRKIIKMNDLEQARTKAYVMGLLED